MYIHPKFKFLAYRDNGNVISLRAIFHFDDGVILLPRPGVNVIKVLHLYLARVAVVSLAESNSCTCKLQV